MIFHCFGDVFHSSYSCSWIKNSPKSHHLTPTSDHSLIAMIENFPCKVIFVIVREAELCGFVKSQAGYGKCPKDNCIRLELTQVLLSPHVEDLELSFKCTFRS